MERRVLSRAKKRNSSKSRSFEKKASQTSIILALLKLSAQHVGRF
jgi:hypothetical protein